MYWDGGMGAWGYVLMSLSFVVFWGAIIVAIVALVRSIGVSNRARGLAGEGTAEILLAERFARGEIDESEYAARLAVLRRNLNPAP